MTTVDLANFLAPCPWPCTEDEGLRQFLYALLDADDHVIYVGRTKHLAKRVSEHRRKAWWSEVADVISLRVCCMDRVSRGESQAIRALAPEHNVDPGESARRGRATRNGIHHDAKAS